MDASGLINLEPPQQPVIMKNKRKSPKSSANETTLTSAAKKNKRSGSSKKKESSVELNKNGGVEMPDSSLKHLGEVNDEESPDTESVGGVTENWSDQQTIKVKVR